MEHEKLVMTVKNLAGEVDDAKDEIKLLRTDVDKLKDFISKLKAPTLD